MHHLTELPMDAVTDATGSVYTGGILWRLTCIVCLIFLLLISMLSPATLGGEGYTLCIFLGLAEFVVAFIVWGAVSSEPTLETDEGCVGKGDLCVSHGMFYASLFAQIVFANVACVFGLLWWHHEEDVWELRREIVGLRDLIRSRWQADRNPL